MAVNVTKNIYQNGAGVVGLNLAASDTLTVSAQAGIFASGVGGSSGVRALGGSTTMNIHGGIFSSNANGIDSVEGNHTISISSTGSLFGHVSGINLGAGGNTVTNAGEINAATFNGVVFANAAGSNELFNSGTIRSGAATAVAIGGNNNTVNNSGLIEASDTEVAVSLSGDVVNSGTIRGLYGIQLGDNPDANGILNSGHIVALTPAGICVAGSAGEDSVVNNGSIKAGAMGIAVFLAGGNDTYDGRGGQVIGAVRGEGGTDTLNGGAFVDRLEGGTENDQINGGGNGDYIDGGVGYDFARYDFANTGVQARLDNAALNTGEAAGDTMYNFEGLVGSQHGDILVGNNLAIGNQIYGLGGNDTIRGNGGADIIYGNAGADSIFTGAGTDTVWVQAADRIATQQDRIFDFTDGQDHLRFQGISAASATITDSQGGTLIQFNVAGGQFSVFLDGITKAASADQIFFV